MTALSLTRSRLRDARRIPTSGHAQILPAGLPFCVARPVMFELNSLPVDLVPAVLPATPAHLAPSRDRLAPLVAVSDYLAGAHSYRVSVMKSVALSHRLLHGIRSRSVPVQGARFALVGALVALVYLLTTTLLTSVAGVSFQIALAIGFSLAITLHFSLQRVFVWTHSKGFALPIGRQMARYLPAVMLQYGVTAASTELLPGTLGLPTEVVYVATVLLLASGNFLFFRRGVFHARA